MTPHRPAALPPIAPCPDPKCRGARVVQDAGLDASVQVVCSCGWTGPHRTTACNAILAWDRRSDAEAERRGAMAAVKWLDETVAKLSNAHPLQLGLIYNLEQAIKSGEVLPSAPEPLIVSRPGKLGGAPHVRGTRIPVAILQPLAGQFSREQILGMYPGLTAEGLAAALAYRLPVKKGAK